jgi:hypothetical protein
MHHRFAPKAHRFAYRIFLFALDLDELASLDRKLRLFSWNRRNLYSFQDGDFLPTHEPLHNRPGPTPDVCHIIYDKHPGLKSRVVAYLAGRGIDLTGGRVLLVTLPRVFGYLFNPVSFYFCYDRHGQPVASIAEVTNTFKEMKPFVLGPECRGPATENGGPNANPSSVPGSPSPVFRLRVPKYFYVSPFTDMDVAFDFTLRTPGDQLSVQIDDHAAGQRTLTSVLHGSRRPLTDGRLAWFSLKYPLITLKVISLIHWNALRLYLKNVPWFAKAARPDAQRDLYRPHLSIANHPEA